MISKPLGKSYDWVVTVLTIVACLLAFTPISYLFESSTSLPVLFKLRNVLAKPQAPDKILIVSPYVKREFNTPDYLRNYDRRDHAAAIDSLVSLGADVIAVDLYFRTKRSEQDEALAASMMDTPSLVLSQLIRPMPITSLGVKGYYLRNPIQLLTNSATMLAPPLLPVTAASVDRVPLFRSVLHSQVDHTCFGFPARAEQAHGSSDPGGVLHSRVVPTFAFAILEQHILKDLRNSERHRLWAKQEIEPELRTRSSCQFLLALRSRQQLDGLSTFPEFAEEGVQRRFRQWQGAISEQTNRQIADNTVVTLHINYFGPPRSIKTLSYADLEAYEKEVFLGTKPNFISGSTVFLGGSFSDPVDQKEDGFRTVFTNGSRRMSGVEINATAFQNLMNDAGIQVLHGWFSLVFTFVAALLVWVVGPRMSMPHISIVIVMTALSTSLFSLYVFAVHGIWLPAGTMVTVLLMLFGVTAAWKYRASSLDRDRAVHHLRSFLSDSIAAQLDSGTNHVVRHAVCLVTDIRNFTEHGSLLDPSVLHTSNDTYFTHLFNCVAGENADVIKTYGDSMTAVWASGDSADLECAVRAGIKILDGRLTEMPTLAGEPFETHIGLYEGDLAIGFVGGDDRRTVEVTGNAVYMAARLEQLNKQLNTRFLTTAEVGGKLRRYSTRTLGKEILKGYPTAVDVVEIMRTLKPTQSVQKKSSTVSGRMKGSQIHQPNLSDIE